VKSGGGKKKSSLDVFGNVKGGKKNEKILKELTKKKNTPPPSEQSRKLKPKDKTARGKKSEKNERNHRGNHWPGQWGRPEPEEMSGKRGKKKDSPSQPAGKKQNDKTLQQSGTIKSVEGGPIGSREKTRWKTGLTGLCVNP